MIRSMLKRIMLGVGAMLIDKSVIAAVQLMLVPVQAVRWGLPIYSLWIILATVPTFLAASDMGFATAAGTKMTMQAAHGDHRGATATYRAAWTGTLVTSLAVAIIGVLLCHVLPDAAFGSSGTFSRGDARLTLALLILYGVIALQVNIYLGGYRSARLFALGTLGHSLIYLAEGVATALVVIDGGSPVAAAATLLLVRCIGLAGQALHLRRSVPWLRPGLRPAPWPEVRELGQPALAALALPIGQSLLMQGTVLALAAAAGPILVPAFTATRTLSRLGLQMTSLLNSAIMPEFSVMHARGDAPAQARMIALTLVASAVLMVPFAGILAIAGPAIVHIWTHGVIAPPRALIWTMSATVVLGGFWNPVSNLILAMNKHGGYTYPFLVLAALSVPLAYLLAGREGATGAALAMLATDCAMCVVVARQATRLLVSPAEIGRGFLHLREGLRGLKLRRA